MYDSIVEAPAPLVRYDAHCAVNKLSNRWHGWSHTMNIWRGKLPVYTETFPLSNSQLNQQCVRLITVNFLCKRGIQCSALPRFLSCSPTSWRCSRYAFSWAQLPPPRNCASLVSFLFPLKQTIARLKYADHDNSELLVINNERTCTFGAPHAEAFIWLRRRRLFATSFSVPLVLSFFLLSFMPNTTMLPQQLSQSIQRRCSLDSRNTGRPHVDTVF